MEPIWTDLGNVSLRHVFLRCGTGNPDGSTIVLLHEMGGSIETWDRVIPVLNRASDVLAYDWRGSGQSEKIAGEVTLDDHVGDLTSLLDALGIVGRVVLAGCAVGAAIAIGFAARCPKRTAGLVLMAPALIVPPEQRPAREGLLARIQAEGLRGIAETSLGGSYPAALREGHEARFADFRARWITNDRHSYLAIYRLLLDLDIAPFLPRIACPVLAVAGTHDPIRTADHVRGISRDIPDAKVVVVPGGHHMPHQIPDISARLIAEFASSEQVRAVDG